MAENLETIVFFDGYCGLCSEVVDLLIVRDKKRKLRYSPLQGETAKAMLDEREREDLDTLIVVRRPVGASSAAEKLTRSDAVLASLQDIGGSYGVLGRAGKIVPRFIRDAIYKLVAKNRYRIFGKRETCRLPSPEERALFLP